MADQIYILSPIKVPHRDSVAPCTNIHSARVKYHEDTPSLLEHNLKMSKELLVTRVCH